MAKRNDADYSTQQAVLERNLALTAGELSVATMHTEMAKRYEGSACARTDDSPPSV